MKEARLQTLLAASGSWGVPSKREMRFAAEIPVCLLVTASRPGVASRRHDFA